MTVILSFPGDRPGFTYSGTTYWRYRGFEQTNPYNVYQPGLPSPSVSFLFSGWVTEQAFIVKAAPADNYRLILTFSEFIQSIAPIIASNSLDFVDPLERILITRPGFTSGTIIPLV